MTEIKSEYRCETCGCHKLTQPDGSNAFDGKYYFGICTRVSEIALIEPSQYKANEILGCASHSAIAKQNPPYQDLIDHIRWTQNLWWHGIEIMRENNLMIASDTPMEKLAFTFYSDLCEIDSRAQHLFGEGPGDENYKNQNAIRAREIVPYPRPYEEAIKQAAEKEGYERALKWIYNSCECIPYDPELRDFDKGFHQAMTLVRGWINQKLPSINSIAKTEKVRGDFK